MNNIFVPNTTDAGEWISERFSILAEVVQDYDSALELRWIPPANRTRDDKKPYVVWDTNSNSPVQYASDLDSPEDVLARIFEGDNKHGNVLLRLEAQERARQTFIMKEWLNRMDEAAEEAEFLMKSPLNWVRFNGKKLDDQRRVIGSSKEVKQL